MMLHFLIDTGVYSSTSLTIRDYDCTCLTNNSSTYLHPFDLDPVSMHIHIKVALVTTKMPEGCKAWLAWQQCLL